MKRTLTVLLAASLAANAAGAPETTSPLSRAVEISITNVDVVVTDAKGRPVPNLSPLDFIVKQDGKTQTITNFSFVRNLPPLAAPPAPAPEEPQAAPTQAAPAPAPGPAGARLVVLLDLVHMTAGNRNRIVKGLVEFLPKAAGPRVEVQIVTWDRALRTRGRFTNEAGVLTNVLNALTEETALGDTPNREKNRLYGVIDSALNSPPQYRQAMIDQAISTVRAWCDSQVSDLDATLQAARALMGTVSGVEGRKILIFATEDLAPSPGRELWDYFTSGVERLSRSAGRLTSTSNLNLLTYKDFDRTPAFQTFASAANGSGVSLFMVDAAGLTGDPMLSAEFGGTGAGISDTISLASLDTQSALQMLANETGGAAIYGRNNIALALESLEPAWTAYYSLGYESSDSKPGIPRSIKVTVNRPGLKVVSRRTIVERTPEQKVSDAVLSGVFFPKTLNPLKASLKIGTPKKDGKMWLVPLDFKIPYDKITLIPTGGRAKGALLFTAVASSPDGRLSPVTTERAPIDVPESELASLSGKIFTYAATLKVRGGPQVFSTALTDEISRLSSYVQPHVLIGDPPPAKR